MKKYIIVLSCLFSIFFTSCQEKSRTKEMDEFIAEFEGMNLEEISTQLNNTIRTLKYFNKIGGSDKEIKNIAQKDEKLRSPFKIDTSMVAATLQQFKDVGFDQIINDTVSEFVFYRLDKEFKEGATLRLSENTTDFLSVNKQSFLPNTIYYKSKEKRTESLKNYEVSFEHFPRAWGKQKIVDSIFIDYKLSYLKAYDSVVLSNSTKKKKYKNGEIKIKKLTDNYLHISVSDSLKKLNYHIYAFNKEGKPLSDSFSNTSELLPKKAKKAIRKFSNFLGETQELFEENSFKTKEEFITYLDTHIKGIDFFRDEDGMIHHEYFYRGNIAEVRIYFETDRVEKIKRFTATNLKIDNDLFPKKSKGKVVFVDKYLNEVVKTDKENLYASGGNFYTATDDYYDSDYYYLDVKEKKLKTLNIHKVLNFNNGIFGIREKKGQSFKIYNKNYELLLAKDCHNYVLLHNDKMILINEHDCFLIDKTGTSKLLKNIAGVYNDGYSEDLLLAYNKKDKVGFINPSGYTVIPFKYHYGNKFSEGLAALAKEDQKFGYINKKGEVILPFKYESAEEFVNGFTMVKFDGFWHIIDRKGKVKAKAKSKYGGFSVSGEGLDRVYQMSDSKYNAFGDLIKE